MFIFLLVICLALSEPLLLTPLIEKGRYDEARKLSRIDYSGNFMGHSGFVTVPSESGKKNNNIFFWLQPCRKCKKDAPFLLWLQGGPGAPGVFGSLGEIGNFYIDKNLKVKERCFSWCDHYNCLFVDQPVQTGFSFQTNETGHYDKNNIEYTTSSKEAMEEVYQLIQQLFTVFTEYKSSPFYITGESYGGNYCAAAGLVIEEHNHKLRKKIKKAKKKGKISKISKLADSIINLKGIAVGDPVMNWEYQMPTYPSTLFGMGVVTENERDLLQDMLDESVKLLQKKPLDCPAAFKNWNLIWNDDQSAKTEDEFLFKKFTGSEMTCNVLLGEDPGEFHWLVEWGNKTDVAEAMHYLGTPSESRWEGGAVYGKMVESGDWCNPSSPVYAELFMKYGIDLMIYSSTTDPLLGPPTTELGIKAIFDYAEKHYEGGKFAKEQFENANKINWKVKDLDASVAGYAKSFVSKNSNRFTYGNVRNAGHMTPSFQPRSAYDLFERFLNQRPFTKAGDDPNLPTCYQCGGAPPFAGSSLKECQ